MRILCLIGKGEHQCALAHRLNEVSPLAEIGLVAVPHGRYPRLGQRLAALTVGWPLRRAWNAMLDHYADRYPLLPVVPVTVHLGVNARTVFEQIERVRPDLVLVSGTDLLRPPLIEAIERQSRVMNLHTGLSPYIRGGPNCTNWALALGDFHLIGNTVMWLDAGIDTGNLIATERTPLDGTEDIRQLHFKVMEHAHDLYCQCLRRFVQDLPMSSRTQHEIEQGRLFLNRQWTGVQMARALYNFYTRFHPETVSTAQQVQLVSLSGWDA